MDRTRLRHVIAYSTCEQCAFRNVLFCTYGSNEWPISLGARKAAEAALDAFIETYGIKHEKAVECLTKDRDTVFAFYDFPAEHWQHLLTTNPIESRFATVRRRKAILGVKFRDGIEVVRSQAQAAAA